MSVTDTDRLRIYLDKVHLKGYKSIEGLSIDFKRGLNILIGKNGSGKSNFMEFLYGMIGSQLSAKINYKQAIIEFNSSDEHKLVIEYEKNPNKIRLEKDNIDDRLDSIERFIIDDKVVLDSSDLASFDGLINFKNKTSFFNPYKKNLRSYFLILGYPSFNSIYLRFNLPDNLECISSPGTLNLNTEQPYSYYDYDNTLDCVADVIWNFVLNYDYSQSLPAIVSKSTITEQFKIDSQIVENLKLYSGITDVRFTPNLNIYYDEHTLIVDNIKLEFKLNSNWLPWSQLSDGIRRLFYIIAEVTNANGLILVEEPELGIHPHQFNLLMDFLKEESKNKQIIISTHSPKALDHLEPDELENILLTYYDIDKGTQIRHLSESEQSKAKRYMKEVGFFSDYWMLSDLE